MRFAERLTVLLVLVLPAWLVTVPAQAAPKIQSWLSAEGARVLFVEAPELPMVDIRVVFDAGSARDGDRPGLGKLTNATVTDGGGDWNADQIADRLAGIGAQLGNDSLRDMSYISLRTLTEPKALGIGLETLAALIGRPRFDTADLERNRQAMQAGLLQEAQNPGSVVRREFMAALYPGHPYGIHTNGTTESLTAITRDEVLAHYRRYYVARNAVVALVGAVDRARAEAIVTQLLAGLPAGEPAPTLAAPAGVQKAGEVRVPFPSSQSHIWFGQTGMRRGDPDFFALSLGNHILGGSGLVSRLSDEVREKRGLSYSVYSAFSPMRETGPFLVAAQTQAAKEAEALEVMRATLKAFAEQGPTEQELDEAKRNITGGFPLETASNAKIIDSLAMIGFYNLPLDYLDTYVSKIEAVTGDQIRDAFKRRIDAGRMITVIVGKAANGG